MLIVKDFHRIHYDVLDAEKKTGRDFSKMGKGSTQKIHMFPNGYGASIIELTGDLSYGVPELAVLYFENKVKFRRSKTKRLKKKMCKEAGGYDLSYSTPITSDIKRYEDHKELQRDLSQLSKLKSYR